MEIVDKLEIVTEEILEDYNRDRDIDKRQGFDQPDNDVIIDVLTNMSHVLFPGYYREKGYRSYNYKNRISVLLEDITHKLKKQMTKALRYRPGNEDTTYDERAEQAEAIVIQFLAEIPTLRAYLDTDLQAFYEGDPAAANKEEIVLCYPGFMATVVNRIAHILFKLDVPLIPRMMTEYAHSKTGIDIHPGATIGKYFFMDHGTGIVIGETTVIGEHVKIYQGVTLGALSTRGGQSLRGKKRHPNIQDNVTIYANASILGGDTVIGEGSVIGGNVFITKSVRPNSLISVKTQEQLISNGGYVEV
ncbi:MAG: serine O-acetyltransferase [Clostridia bacterium]|nr:serine O-acetyltransferase [Clostridia bacterium]